MFSFQRKSIDEDRVKFFNGQNAVIQYLILDTDIPGSGSAPAYPISRDNRAYRSAGANFAHARMSKARNWKFHFPSVAKNKISSSNSRRKIYFFSKAFNRFLLVKHF